MPTGNHAERYHRYQLETPAWKIERQRKLKRRVFETFSMWLRSNGLPPLGPGRKVVDLGSGAGTFVECCREEGIDARGIDISDGINLETDDLPIASDSVDVVTAISVLEHLRSPEKMLSETMRILKPEGAVILVCPNWKYSVKTFFDDPTHVHPYTPGSMRQVLAMYGFEAVEVAPWLVKKPAWMWFLRWRFFVAFRVLPFRGDAPRWIPGFLKGRSSSLLAIGRKARKTDR
ncbi:MAG TPA: class I SAM-dependent methyltransferase [Methyloceanibacter sp.]|nr:class I SAM-dependent methyltransferase [Methyloceanibacter sp.]